jgi:transposase-like protein
MSIKHEKPNKGVRGRTPSYSASFKVQLALEYLDGDYSYTQIARKYELSPRQVEWFVSWYRKNQPRMVIEEPSEAEPTPLNKQDSKDLEKKLALAEMKIAALEKVIALANEEYGTDLKKKAATK